MVRGNGLERTVLFSCAAHCSYDYFLCGGTEIRSCGLGLWVLSFVLAMAFEIFFLFIRLPFLKSTLSFSDAEILCLLRWCYIEVFVSMLEEFWGSWDKSERCSRYSEGEAGYRILLWTPGFQSSLHFHPMLNTSICLSLCIIQSCHLSACEGERRREYRLLS
ncbi:hypothetical protein BCR34DRAFT_243722 [Clohesyomyces aquaticus]|uniref:Uncharacterized protein n=1 Tax=Clohesyomyces aquaticus TaxID=1231657 RepID=A0A1Y1Y4V4_9PLEO|nr:hypothetical protein BCR34DRAFT_243722 [Clohesyomyces aquaticus]